MRAKVPSDIAHRWRSARRLYRDMEKVDKMFRPQYSSFAEMLGEQTDASGNSIPGKARKDKDGNIIPGYGGYTKDNRAIRLAARDLIRAIGARAKELECPC